MGVQLNEDRWCVIRPLLDPASVAANTTAEQTFTVPGLKIGDVVHVSRLAFTAGLMVGAAGRVTAADTLAITFGNFTGSPIDPTAAFFRLWVFRPEKVFDSVTL